MSKSSSNRSVEDLENKLLQKNKDLNEKYLELETLLDLTNTINSLDDLEELFYSVLTLSSSILNSGKGIVLLKNDISNIFDASKEIKNISNILGGKGGGGRKDMAQGGGSDISQIQNCLEYIEKKLISIN